MAATWKDPDLGKSAEELFAERAKRMDNAFALKQPDRVPIALFMSYFLADYGGITKQELHENPVKYQELLEKAALDFQADAPIGLASSPVIPLLLGDRVTKWPGHGVGPNDDYQFVEGEYMKPEEYDDFLLNPSDYVLRTFLPRTTTRLEGLSQLNNTGLYMYGAEYGNFAPWANPAVASALQALKEAADASSMAIGAIMASGERLAALGFPPSPFGAGHFALAPFDMVSDFMRGMKGGMLDMHRRPDKLLEAVDKIRRMMTKEVIAECKATGMKYTLSMLHRGSDGFMSPEQFERFYWPSLKQMWLDFIDAGLTPWVFYEGNWDQRLKYLAELPKGKTIGMFQSTDLFKAKDVIGDTICLWGGMPNSMLQSGSVEEIRDRTKKLCQVVGKGGGFVMGTQIGEMEGSRPDLVRAWVQATKEFGTY